VADGVIKWITGKGFGYIDLGGGKDIFFHRSAVEEARFEDLRGASASRSRKAKARRDRGPRT
jgi:cold shock CspA family protein